MSSYDTFITLSINYLEKAKEIKDYFSKNFVALIWQHRLKYAYI